MTDRKLTELFYVGGRAHDLEAEVEFLRIFEPESVGWGEGDHQEVRGVRRAMVTLGGTRLYFSGRKLFDPHLAQLGLPVREGITHVGFLTDDLDALIAAAAEHGVEPFIGPYETSSTLFGVRRFAFFLAPSGWVLEVQQPLEDP